MMEKFIPFIQLLLMKVCMSYMADREHLLVLMNYDNYRPLLELSRIHCGPI